MRGRHRPNALKHHKKLPVVLITAADHYMASPHQQDNNLPVFSVVGILFKETKTTLHLATWVMGNNLSDEENEGFLIIKTPGYRKKVIGYVE